MNAPGTGSRDRPGRDRGPGRRHGQRRRSSSADRSGRNGALAGDWDIGPRESADLERYLQEALPKGRRPPADPASATSAPRCRGSGCDEPDLGLMVVAFIAAVVVGRASSPVGLAPARSIPSSPTPRRNTRAGRCRVLAPIGKRPATAACARSTSPTHRSPTEGLQGRASRRPTLVASRTRQRHRRRGCSGTNSAGHDTGPAACGGPARPSPRRRPGIPVVVVVDTRHVPTTRRSRISRVSATRREAA